MCARTVLLYPGEGADTRGGRSLRGSRDRPGAPTWRQYRRDGHHCPDDKQILAGIAQYGIPCAGFDNMLIPSFPSRKEFLGYVLRFGGTGHFLVDDRCGRRRKEVFISASDIFVAL